MSLLGDLVSDAETFETFRLLKRVHAPEKSRKELPDTNSGRDRIEANMILSGPSNPPTPGVDHQQNGHVQIGLVDLEDEAQNVGDLTFGGSLPLLLTKAAPKPGQPLDRYPVFFGPVQHPVGELRVDGNLVVDSPGEQSMVMLKIGHAVVMVSDGLVDGFGTLDLIS